MNSIFRKFILGFVFIFLFCGNALADKFWVGGTGNSNDPTNHWATSTGGAPGVGNTPTAADNCVFDGSSGAGTATINAALTCRSLLTSGSSVTTIVHNAAVTITLGDATAGTGNKALDLSGISTYTLGDVATSAIAFVSTSATQQTIALNGRTLGNLSFTGASQNYAFTSNITLGATATITYTGGASSQLHFDGAADTSALTHSIGKFITSGSNVCTIALGNSAITITGTGTVWDMGTTANHSLTQGNSGTLVTNGNAAIMGYGSANCAYKSITQHIGTGTETNGGTFIGIGGGGATIVNLTVDSTGGPDDRISVGGANSSTNSFTVTGVWTITGATSNSARITMWPNAQASVKKCTVTGATLNFTYVDIQDINFVSTGAVDFSGVTGAGAVGDAGGNSVTGGGTLSFLPATTQHATGTTSFNWSDVTRWTSRIPLAHDNVVFDNAFSAGQTVTADRKWLCKDLDMTGGTGNVTIQGSGVASSERYTVGSVTWRSGMTWAGNSSIWQLNCRGTCNYTDNGVTKSSISKITIQAGNGGTFYFLDNASLGTFRLYGGTIDFNNKDITAASIEIGSNTAASATIWNLGTGTLTLTASSGNVLFPTTSVATNYTQLTVNPSSSTIFISNTGASSKTFEGGAKTYYNLKVAGGGAGAIIIKSSNTFNRILTDGGGTKTITLTSGETTTLVSGAGLANGTNLITFNATATTATIAKTTGILSWDYVSLTNIPSSGTPYFFAGPLTHSTDGGGNTGWIFVAAPTTGGGGGSSKMGISL